ncbi:MAG: hypothetical protein WBJ84_10800 [Bacteroidales bacterium]
MFSRRVISLGKTTFSLISLLVIPFFIFFTGYTLRAINQEYSLFAFDPEFSYLLSGILLGKGSFNLFIDHPGTPLIVFAAIVTRIVYIFRSASSYTDDVLQNPDQYLSALNISMIILISVVVFLVSLWIYRKTGNLPAAIFIQFSPFVAEYVFSVIERYMPEPWFIALVVILCGTTLLDMYGAFDHGKAKNKRPLIYGIIIGAGISLKFTFFPFIIAPLFIIRGMKKKLFYLASAMISFLVFTFPLIKRGKVFFNWINSIVLHTGKHGSGKASVIDPQQFILNLKTIIQSEKHLVYAALIAIFILLCSLLPFIRKRIANKRYINALAGFLMAMIVGVLAISKHYEAYYLIPYSLITVFLFYLSVNVIFEILQFRKRWAEAIIYGIIALVMLLNPKSLKQHEEYLEIRKQIRSHNKSVAEQVSTLPKADALVITADYWHIRKESGLMFGMLMTPAGGKKFGKQLNSIYPDTYLFKEWEESFTSWFDKPYTAAELINTYPVIQAMVKHYDQNSSEAFKNVFISTGLADVNLIYSDLRSGIHVYEISRLDLGKPDSATEILQ